MSQHDYNIANGGGAAVRADINNALLAILSQNSGATAPTTTKPFMYWYDTANSILKQRNAADTAWLTIMDANGVQFGGQIKFPASQNASSDANTLDDYEEGTWTPAFNFAGGSSGVVYSFQTGLYTKIGNTVTAQCYVSMSSKGTASGQMVINLPFTASSALSNNYVAASLRGNGITGISGGLTGYVSPNTANFYVEYAATGATQSLTAALCNNNADIMLQVVYKV